MRLFVGVRDGQDLGFLIRPADHLRISIAMNNTAFALMVAIPFLLIHAFLQARTSEIVDSLEVAKISFLNLVERVKSEPAPTK